MYSRPRLAALRYIVYFLFMDDVIFARNGPYGGDVDTVVAS